MTVNRILWNNLEGYDVQFRFCPVCRYIVVDRLDPSQHGAIDDDYETQYPEP